MLSRDRDPRSEIHTLLYQLDAYLSLNLIDAGPLRLLWQTTAQISTNQRNGGSRRAPRRRSTSLYWSVGPQPKLPERNRAVTRGSVWRSASAGPVPAGIIAATRGNHGRSIAFAARRCGLQATIVVPHRNSVETNTAMRALGAELIAHGRDFQDALEHASEVASEHKLVMVPSFHEWLVTGVATYGLELLQAISGIDTVYVPIGLGSGICGTIAAREALGLTTRIVGVVSDAAPTYALSFAARKPVPTESAITDADGLAVRVPHADAVEIINRSVERVITVSDREIEEAMRHYFTDTHNVAEGAGAAALAALLKERDQMRVRRVRLVLSGGNVDRATYARILADGTATDRA